MIHPPSGCNHPGWPGGRWGLPCGWRGRLPVNRELHQEQSGQDSNWGSGRCRVTGEGLNLLCHNTPGPSLAFPCRRCLFTRECAALLEMACSTFGVRFGSLPSNVGVFELGPASSSGFVLFWLMSDFKDTHYYFCSS